MNANNDLSGKIALITGGARGIGKEIAFEIGKRGATVIITYLKNHTAAKTTINELNAKGIAATRIKSNAGDETSIQALVKKIDEQFGRIDILVNNAGITQNLPLALLEEDRDLRALQHRSRRLARHRAAQPGRARG